jgi:pantothenate synthetase
MFLQVTMKGRVSGMNKKTLSEEEKEALLLQHELQQVEAFEESKSKYRKIVNAGIRQWVQDFQDGNIRIDTVDDLKKLVELDLQLQRDEF